MTTIRRAAVAGSFYPNDPVRLRDTVREYLDGADARDPVPKAIIAPHAGFVYSGPIAGSAYAQLAPAREALRRVVLLGPAHFVRLDGLALSSARFFESPLGMVPVDNVGQTLLSLPQVQILDRAHAREHSLEVQLPFLQLVLGNFTLVPLAVGSASPEATAEAIDRLWGGPETVVVISSDLSHYHDYPAACRLDQATSLAIEHLEPVDQSCACGAHAINGLLHVARARKLSAVRLDVRNSGDTAGPRDSVVGYGAYAFYPPAIATA